MSARAIALQLTHDTACLFDQLLPHEFMGCAWSKPSMRDNSSHVSRLMQRSNAISAWVSTSILYGTSFNDRAELYAKFVDLLVVCTRASMAHVALYLNQLTISLSLLHRCN